MPRSDHQPAEPSNNAEGRYDSRETESRSGPQEGMLDAVLRETASAYLADESAQHAATDQLVEVARRHFRQELILDPVVVDLVEAVLVQRLEISPEKQRAWRPVVQVVARTLWEDAASRSRLARLWGRLHEALE